MFTLLKILIIITLGVILLMVLFSPVEALGWWAGWYGSEAGGRKPSTVVDKSSRRFLVYLGGINEIDGKTLTGYEERFLKALEDEIPDLVIVKTVFPYSPENKGLTTNRLFSGVWRWLAKHRKRFGETPIAMLINLRNILQVGVVADARYGTFYSLAMAQSIYHELLKSGYPEEGIAPVTVMGYSGGGPVAVGSAQYLEGFLGAKVQVISLGGVLYSDPGLLHLRHLYHLYGSNDTTQNLGAIFSAGRWAISPGSYWNRALRVGIISKHCIGPMTHTGKRTYYTKKFEVAPGVTYVDKTLEYVKVILYEDGADRWPWPKSFGSLF